MSQANVAIVQNLYAAFLRGDIASILDACSPDVDWQSNGRKEDYPTFGMRKGKAEVQEFFHIIAATHDFNEFSPRDFYGDRDKVFVLGRLALTVKKNGRKAASEWVHILTFRDGKVVHFHEFLDTGTIAQAYRD